MSYIFIPQNENNRKHWVSHGGFIALITAIILSVILITVTIALNRIGFLTRSEISDAEYKSRSSALAEACVDSAFLKIASDPAYAGGEIINVGGDSCEIRPVQHDVPSVGQNTVETKAVFQEAATDLRIVVDAGDLSIVSWDEVPSF